MTENMKVQTAAEIKRELTSLGIKVTPAAIKAERDYQAAMVARAREDRIIDEMPDSEVAEQIRDHRAAGRWTTQLDTCPAEPNHQA